MTGAREATLPETGLEGEVPRGGLPGATVAVFWFLASEITLFGSLFALYVLFATRLLHWADGKETWSHGHLYLATVCLGLASLGFSRAHRNVGLSPVAVTRWLALGVACGVLFLAVKAWSVVADIQRGLGPGRGPFWQFYHLLSMLHATHVAGGLVAALWVGGSTMGTNENVAAQRARWKALLYYWGFVDAVWLVLLYLWLRY